MALVLDHLRLKRHHYELYFHFNIPHPTFCLVMGYNGAGKSTLLHAISGLEIVHKGHILFQGQLIDQMAPANRPLTILFQKDNVFPSFSVRDNVALGLRGTLELTPAEEQQMDTLLQALGLMAIKPRLIQTLSADQQQRTALARCLMRKRPLMLLDDPLPALDQRHRQTVMDQLFHLHHQYKSTILMSTHMVHHAWAEKTWVLFIGRCQVIALAQWDKVWRHPHPDVQDFYRTYLKTTYV